MKAWSVAILAQLDGGQASALLSIFTLAETKGEAIAAGVRHTFDIVKRQDGAEPMINITQTQACQVASEVILEAAGALATEPG